MKKKKHDKRSSAEKARDKPGNASGPRSKNAKPVASEKKLATSVKRKIRSTRKAAKSSRKLTRRIEVPDPAEPAGEGLIVFVPDFRVALGVQQGPESQKEEIENAVRALHEHGQISREPGPLPPGATHSVQVDEEGKKTLVRRRFSAT